MIYEKGKFYNGTYLYQCIETNPPKLRCLGYIRCGTWFKEDHHPVKVWQFYPGTFGHMAEVSEEELSQLRQVDRP